MLLRRRALARYGAEPIHGRHATSDSGRRQKVPRPRATPIGRGGTDRGAGARSATQERRRERRQAMKRLLPLLLVLSACGAAPPQAPKLSENRPISSPAPLPATPARDPLSVPPASGITPSAPFPAIARRTLSNGLEVAVISRKTLPIVELRLLF